MEIFYDAKIIKTKMDKKIMESRADKVSSTFVIAEKDFTKISNSLKGEYNIISERIDNEFLNLDVEWKKIKL